MYNAFPSEDILTGSSFSRFNLPLAALDLILGAEESAFF